MIFRSLHVKCSVYLIIYCIHCHLGHCIWARYHYCMSHSLKLSVKNQEQIFCAGIHLFLFVSTNKTVAHTRQWVKFCIYLLYNYCSVNLAKPALHTHNTECKHSLTRGLSRTRLLEASIDPPLCSSTTAAFYRTSQTPVLVTAGWRRLTQCQAPVAAGVGVRLKVALLLWCRRALARSLLPHHCSLTLCLPQAVFLTADNRE